MKKLKNMKGITLIALVITIVVLLILAGVTIAMLTGDNGILTKAQSAKANHTVSQAKEQIELAVTAAKMENNGQSINKAILKKELERLEVEGLPENAEDIQFELSVKLNEYMFLINEDGKVELINGISIPSSLYLTIGETKEIKCIKSEEITETVMWAVEDANIATIDVKTGDVVNITAVSEGETMLTVTANSKEVKCKVSVQKEISKDGTEITQQYLQKIATGWLNCVNNTEAKTLSEICNNESLLSELMENESAFKYYISYENVINPILTEYNTKDIVDSYFNKIYLIPVMTSNEEPSGEAIFSSQLSDDTLAYKAFNGSNKNELDCWHSISENEPWIGYKFDSNTYVDGFEFVVRNASSYYYAPNKLAIDGSNDGRNWNEIQEYTYSNAGLGAKSVISEEVSNNIAYQYYRIRYKDYSGYGACGSLQFYQKSIYTNDKVEDIRGYTSEYKELVAKDLLELISYNETKNYNQILSDTTILNKLSKSKNSVKYILTLEDSIKWELLPLLSMDEIVPVMTSNEEPSGKAIASSEYNNASLAYKAFNGSNENRSDCWHSISENEPWIGYKFDSNTYVNKFKFVVRNDASWYYAPTKLAIDGSNDGGSWDEIQEYTYSGLSTNSVIEQEVANTNTYKYYRIRYKDYSGFGACGMLQFYGIQM
jgi:type II secretory pathway pseudopilin PulG